MAACSQNAGDVEQNGHAFAVRAEALAVEGKVKAQPADKQHSSIDEDAMTLLAGTGIHVEEAVVEKARVGTDSREASDFEPRVSVDFSR